MVIRGCKCTIQGPTARYLNPRIDRKLTKESTACGPITYYVCECKDCGRKWEEEL